MKLLSLLGVVNTIKPKNVGGQAVIEGVMMKGAEDYSIAVRKPDGEIVVKREKLRGNRKVISKIPVIRGIYAFVDSMVLGVKSLMYSAEFVEEEEEKDKKPSKLDSFLNDNIIWISVVISVAFSVGLFILLPTVVVDVFKPYTANKLILNGLEGIARIIIFLGYIIAVSRMKDIQRVFEYHGAEHKSIFCYEYGDELTVSNVRKYGRLHPRCGTSFLFIVMIISILVFSMFSWSGVLMRLLTRLIAIPFVAGISYEIIKWAGKSQSKLSCIVSAPGMWLQKITTREPDDKQIEVAIEALKNVLVADPEADNW
ncbi:MAG TPA: DUF1385 domain-containing protein [Negativicutes bacterium]|nr:DUF1385 domain-containing protein [Negativicutes bacterium]